VTSSLIAYFLNIVTMHCAVSIIVSAPAIFATVVIHFDIWSGWWGSTAAESAPWRLLSKGIHIDPRGRIKGSATAWDSLR
jgi:hypothetical protein